MLAEISKRHALGQVLVDESVRHVGDEHLAAMGGGADPGGLVHAQSDITLPTHARFARVQADPHVDVDAFRPAVGREGPLSCDRVPRPPKRDEERVALSVDLVPAGVLEGRPEDLLMVCL